MSFFNDNTYYCTNLPKEKYGVGLHPEAVRLHVIGQLQSIHVSYYMSYIMQVDVCVNILNKWCSPYFYTNKNISIFFGFCKS